VLFSEPKIPQCRVAGAESPSQQVFQCSSASRKFLNLRVRATGGDLGSRFSALQRAENSSMYPSRHRPPATICRVSVLFSEPKIPQSRVNMRAQRGFDRFSALQRAENSSIVVQNEHIHRRSRFSALQRAENSSIMIEYIQPNKIYSFSALQRAENSSIYVARLTNKHISKFQCSSASRKFLNTVVTVRSYKFFSVSVLFSEPKIPQCASAVVGSSSITVSVLFSEPKIPQSRSIATLPVK